MRTKSLVVRHNTWPAPFESAIGCAKENGKVRVQKSSSSSERANKNIESTKEKESIDKRKSGGEKAIKVKVLAPRCKLCCPPNKSPGGLCCSPSRVLKPHKISELGYLRR